jgi:hypothetical protein
MMIFKPRFVFGDQPAALFGQAAARGCKVGPAAVFEASGVFAAGIHSFFLLRGDAAFSLPVSLGLLVITLVLSLAQGVALLVATARTWPSGRQAT